MPCVKISVDLGGGVRLPSEDKHMIQGFFYVLLSDDPNLSAAVHDAAPQLGRHTYKLFTFSGLKARETPTEDGRLFSGAGEIEFRSPSMRLCEAVSGAVGKRRLLRLGGAEVTITGMTLSQRYIFTDVLEIRMVTPLTVHRRLENGFTRYFWPSEPEFARMIAENFARKYLVCFDEPPTDGVSLSPRLVAPDDRIETRFKGTIIRGSLGRFILRGQPEYLSFLYDCGLGDRNSQGFGMFEVDEPLEC